MDPLDQSAVSTRTCRCNGRADATATALGLSSTAATRKCMGKLADYSISSHISWHVSDTALVLEQSSRSTSLSGIS